MAALSVRTVKVFALSGASLPLIGFFGQVSAHSMDGDSDMDEPIRACDIPMYPVARKVPCLLANEPKPEPNVVQQQITSIRIFGTAVVNQILDGYGIVRDKAQIGVDHSKATLDFVQTNPGELPRVGFISLATVGGIIIGYRRSILRKLLYASVAGLSATAVCYPNRTVDLSNALTEDARRLWRDNIGWPLSDNDSHKPKSSLKVPEESKFVQVLKMKEDHGQSKPEDKDLYSTRSS